MREPAIEDSHEGLHRTELACARECRKVRTQGAARRKRESRLTLSRPSRSLYLG